jgi:TRAP-type uncharacterized transport system fused permease subunit
VKLGLATFIVPFMFFASPALLGQGPWLGIAHVFVTAALGVFLLASSTEGWLHGPLTPLLRAALFVAAILLIVPEAVTDAIGLGAGAMIWAWQRWQNGADPAARVPAPILPASR